MNHKGLKHLADKINSCKLLLTPSDLSEMCGYMVQLVEHLDINKAIFLGSESYVYIEVALRLNLGIVRVPSMECTMGDRVLIITTHKFITSTVELIQRQGAVPVAILTDLLDVSFTEIPSYSLFLRDSKQTLQCPDLPFYPINEYASQSPEDCRTVVMSHPSSYTLANRVIDQDHSKYRWGYVLWDRFNDTYPNIKFDTNLADKDVIFVMSMHDPGTFMEQLSVIMVLPRQQIRSLRIMMSYFAPGTMDRVDTKGIIATAETVATIMSSCISTTKTGSPILEIYDIHALQEQFYFKDQVIVELKSAIPILTEHYGRDWVIVFPDDGASKRYGPAFRNYKKIVCTKKRAGDKRFIEIKDKIGWTMEPPEGRAPEQFIIVDDLVQSGSTLLECAKMLHETMKDCTVHAFVTHAIFPDRSYRRFMKDDCPIDRFVCTDSNPAVTDILERIPKFKVLSLIPTASPPLPLNYVYVASTNKDKLAAVSDAQGATGGHNCRVFGIDVPSSVNAQPVDDDAVEGCKNRLSALKKEASKYNPGQYWALESGISYHPPSKSYQDQCHIMRDPQALRALEASRDPRDSWLWSESVTVPDYAVVESRASGWTKTCGSIIEASEGLEPGSWHEVHGSQTRKQLMQDVVEKILDNVDSDN